MSNISNINLQVTLDDNKIPSEIIWSASSSEIKEATPAKAFMLSLWDGAQKEALRIDLWTKEMRVDEMNDFFFQSMMTMADTYARATQNDDLSEEIKSFAKQFYLKADEKMKQTEGKGGIS